MVPCTPGLLSKMLMQPASGVMHPCSFNVMALQAPAWQSMQAFSRRQDTRNHLLAGACLTREAVLRREESTVWRKSSKDR